MMAVPPMAVTPPPFVRRRPVISVAVKTEAVVMPRMFAVVAGHVMDRTRRPSVETAMRDTDVTASAVRSDTNMTAVTATMADTGVTGMSAAATTRMRSMSATAAASSTATTTVMSGKRRCRKHRGAGDRRRVHNCSRECAHGRPSRQG